MSKSYTGKQQYPTVTSVYGYTADNEQTLVYLNFSATYKDSKATPSTVAVSDITYSTANKEYTNGTKTEMEKDANKNFSVQAGSYTISISNIAVPNGYGSNYSLPSGGASVGDVSYSISTREASIVVSTDKNDSYTGTYNGNTQYPTIVVKVTDTASKNAATWQIDRVTTNGDAGYTYRPIVDSTSATVAYSRIKLTQNDISGCNLDGSEIAAVTWPEKSIQAGSYTVSVTMDPNVFSIPSGGGSVTYKIDPLELKIAVSGITKSADYTGEPLDQSKYLISGDPDGVFTQDTGCELQYFNNQKTKLEDAPSEAGTYYARILIKKDLSNYKPTYNGTALTTVAEGGNNYYYVDVQYVINKITVTLEVSTEDNKEFWYDESAHYPELTVQANDENKSNGNTKSSWKISNGQLDKVSEGKYFEALNNNISVSWTNKSGGMTGSTYPGKYGYSVSVSSGNDSINATVKDGSGNYTILGNLNDTTFFTLNEGEKNLVLSVADRAALTSGTFYKATYDTSNKPSGKGEAFSDPTISFKKPTSEISTSDMYTVSRDASLYTLGEGGTITLTAGEYYYFGDNKEDTNAKTRTLEGYTTYRWFNEATLNLDKVPVAYNGGNPSTPEATVTIWNGSIFENLTENTHYTTSITYANGAAAVGKATLTAKAITNSTSYYIGSVSKDYDVQDEITHIVLKAKALYDANGSRQEDKTIIDSKNSIKGTKDGSNYRLTYDEVLYTAKKNNNASALAVELYSGTSNTPLSESSAYSVSIVKTADSSAATLTSLTGAETYNV
ncbi:MAG: hypothetical protein IJ679_09950, partial [Lachnospiraceae bacterium]|nr:hypothetical protein [Lachnospiraceae bacterium]